MRRIVVDLPAPLGPRKPVTEPGTTSKDRLRTAALPPNVLLSPRAWISAIVTLSPGIAILSQHPREPADLSEAACGHDPLS